MSHKHGFQLHKTVKPPVVKESNRLKLMNLIAKRQDFEKQHPYPPYSNHPTTINFSDIEGKILLHYAIEAGDLNDVKRLIEAGADINTRVNAVGKRTPFELALQNGQLEIAKYLYEKKADCTKTLLSTAAPGCREWFKDIIQNEVIKGADYNPRWFDEWGDSGSSLLKIHRAAEVGDLDYLNEVLSTQSKIDGFKKILPALLNLAAANGQLPVINLLIQSGFSANPTIDYQESALQAAVRFGEINTAIHLLALGADINWQNNLKYTALSIAIENNHFNAVKELLKHHADISGKDVFGNTVLHLAIAAGNDAILKELLLQSNASKLLLIKNIYGETPLDLAIKTGNIKAQQLLSPGFASELGSKSHITELQQNKIIRNFLYYLRSQYRETDSANPDGYCNGFEFLFQYYTAKGMGDYFFNTLELLANWNGETSTPMFEKFAEWLNDVSWFQHSIEGFYTTSHNDRVGQYTLVEKTKDYMPCPISDNYGGFGVGDDLNEQQLNELLSIFNKMPTGARLYFGGGEHATGAWLDDNRQLIYYDSNHRRRTAPLDNPQSLVEVLINTKYIWVKKNKPANEFPLIFHFFYFEKDKQHFLDPNYHIFSPQEFPDSKEAARAYQNNSPNQLSHLHIALMTRCLPSLKRLLDDGFCDINAKGGSTNQTPMELAIRWDFKDAIPLLLSNPNLSLDNPPFLLSAYNRDMTDVVNKVIANPKSKNLNELMNAAILKNDLETIKQLIENKKVDIGTNSSFLCMAIDYDKTEIVEYLLLKGASITAAYQDKSAIAYAIYDWNAIREQKSFEVIIEHMDNLDILDEQGKAAIHYAIEYGKHSLLKLLLEKGAKPDVVSHNQQTIKDIFVESGRACSLEGFELIQSSTFPFDWNDTKDAALLHKALFDCIACYKQDLFENLLTNAPLEVLNRHNEMGMTLLHAAIINNEYQLAEKLILAGVDVNAQGKKSGNTCLHVITNDNNSFPIEYLKLFLAHGAKLDIPNKKNETALEYITNSDRAEFVSVLNSFANNGNQSTGITHQLKP